jgi:hypothetical protein
VFVADQQFVVGWGLCKNNISIASGINLDKQGVSTSKLIFNQGSMTIGGINELHMSSS